jgi:TonB family protein
MNSRFAALTLAFLVAGSVAAQQNDDDAVIAAALATWQKSLRGGVELRLGAERYSLKLAGIASFSSKLMEAGASMPLAMSFFARNEEKSGWLPKADASGMTVWEMHVARPGFDDERSHALIAGAADRSTIYIATLEKKDGVWRTTWTGTMTPMREETPAVERAPLPPDLAPLRVGGDVKAPILVKRVDPIIPGKAVEERISGIVIVEVIIDKSGRVRDVQVLKPLPFGVDAAVSDAVREWEFRPGTLNKVPVDVIYNLTVVIRAPS